MPHATTFVKIFIVRQLTSIREHRQESWALHSHVEEVWAARFRSFSDFDKFSSGTRSLNYTRLYPAGRDTVGQEYLVSVFLHDAIQKLLKIDKPR